MSRILLLGPRFNKENPKKVGGIIVLFEDLINQLDNKKIQYLIIDTNKENYANKFFAFLSIYFQFFAIFTKCTHISLHGTVKDYLFISPFIIFISKLFNKKTSLRKFAGNFHHFYDSYNPIYKHLIDYSLKNSNQLFFETKELVTYFSEFNKNTFWFPNVRDIEQKEFKARNYSKKFVFISSVKKTKGIDEIINAFQELPSEYSVDIFGPIQDKEINLKYFDVPNVSYQGAIESLEVINTLKEYDVLLLPTYHSGEGYPGIIIEAFSLGIPSISTYWNAIPELITDGENGLLIHPKQYLELKEKILSIDEEYDDLSRNAYDSYFLFSSEKQTKLYLERIEFLC